jgi:hypothetical protein
VSLSGPFGRRRRCPRVEWLAMPDLLQDDDAQPEPDSMYMSEKNGIVGGPIRRTNAVINTRPTGQRIR